MSDPYGSMPPPPDPGQGPYGQGPYGQGGYGYPAPAPRGPRPPSVENAVRLMFVRAAISLVSVIVTFATENQLKSRIARANPALSRSEINTTFTAAIAVSLVLAVAGLVFYVFLAFQVRAGKNWARITTWVLAGLGVLGAIVSLAGTATPVARAISLVVGLFDVAVIVLLAQGTSNRYFKPLPY